MTAWKIKIHTQRCRLKNLPLCYNIINYYNFCYYRLVFLFLSFYCLLPDGLSACILGSLAKINCWHPIYTDEYKSSSAVQRTLLNGYFQGGQLQSQSSRVLSLITNSSYPNSGSSRWIAINAKLPLRVNLLVLCDDKLVAHAGWIPTSHPAFQGSAADPL